VSVNRRNTTRLSRFEEVESRLLLSAQPTIHAQSEIQLDDQSQVEVAPISTQSFTVADELTGLDQVRTDYGFSGLGQTVVVIDTGIAYTHEALGGGFGSDYRVVGGYDFAEGDTNPYDDGIAGAHGTHVAGIIGADDNLAPGVAPGVDLVALRVFDDAGHGSFELVEEALEWVYQNRNAFENPITTVNLSLGNELNVNSAPGWTTIEDDLARLEQTGMFITVAAGNDFEDYQQPGLSYPAASEYVVPVASVDDSGTLSYFSQRSQRVIAAPGRAVLSTVPDYVGNGNGIDDDYARFSGTSMAAPYVAGAGVLLREAYEFVGVTDIVGDDIYDLMVTTADTVFDPITGQSYNRLNLAAAFDAIMPADDFASTQSAAHELGPLDAALSLSGSIERLGDQDWFSFTAATTGTANLALSTTAGSAPRWLSQPADDTLTMDVVAGQTYVVGVGAGDALSQYTVDVTLQGTSSYIDLGTVDQQSFDDVEIDGQGRWFTVTAANDGTLTVEAAFSHAAGDIDLQLFDADKRQLAYSYSSSNSERIDIDAVAGQTFLLKAFVYGGGNNDDVDFRVTNLVDQSGGMLEVLGTAGDDVFTYSAAAGHHDITINGVEYRFSPTVVNNVRFDGMSGFDTATLGGTSGVDRAALRPGSAELSGSGYSVAVAGSEKISIDAAGGQDTATFEDSAGNDTFTSSPMQGRMHGRGFDNSVEGFERIVAMATSGGTDLARLHDSAGDDTFIATPERAELFSDGFHVQVNQFETVHAYAFSGGQDTAAMYGSAGDDTFLATPTQGALFGPGYYNMARNFDSVEAHGTAGNRDTAKFYDSLGRGTTEIQPGGGSLFGDGFNNIAEDFATVYAYTSAGRQVVELPATRTSIETLQTSGGSTPAQASAARDTVIANFSAWVHDLYPATVGPVAEDADREEMSAVDMILKSQIDWDQLG